MLWHKKPLYQPPQIEELNGGASGGGGGGMFVKVMTDEQMEMLSKQITAYATICEQLVDSHKSLTSQHHLGGVRLENLYHDPLLISSGHKITVRQRWTPTSAQLKILERIFEKGNGTPKKEKISEITKELLQHGKISENNVYNWFQNRRARSKRKQPVPATSSNGEPEVDPQDLQSPVLTQELCYQNPETSSARCSNETMRASKPKLAMQTECTSKPCDPSNKMSFYGSMFPERMDHRLGNMEVSGRYNPYMQLEDYNTSMTG